nr:9-beta-pimara-7,15-diene synthase, chloroplastic-like [Lolium perenne]
MLSNSIPRVAGGASSVLLAHRRQAASGHALPAAVSAPSLSKFRQRRTSHLCLASAARAEEHGSSHGELFARGRHGAPRLYPICARRTRTMISSCLAYTEKILVEENVSMQKKERVARIKKELQEHQWLPSPYDTAWVAMVPSQGIPQAPCFPQCVEWILQNQQDNGSWGIRKYDSSNDKCSLLSTLACILALKKWNVGPEHISRGMKH